jgi:hypothetical protein
MPFIYRMMPRTLGLVDEWPTVRPLGSVAILGLNVMFWEAYNIQILQVWFLSIDICFIVLHVKFEDALSISVSIHRATRRKNAQLGIEKRPKKSNVSRRLYFNPRSLMCLIGQALVHRCMSEFPRWLKHVQKSKVMEIFLKYALLTGWEYDEIICRTGPGITILV